MFIALNKLKGSTLFASDGIWILKINSNAIQSSIPEQVMADLEDIPLVDEYGIPEQLGPRYPEFIVLFPKNTAYLSEEVLNKIEEESLNFGFGTDLQKVSQILKCHKAREEKHVNVRSLFHVGRIDDAGLISLNIVGQVKADLQPKTFEMESVKKNNEEANFLHFINEFENFTIPIVERASATDKNVPLCSTLELISRVKKRSGLTGRVSSTYNVYKSFGKNRPQIYFKRFPIMKIEEMLNFFGALKKCQTKVETLCECLRGWTGKYTRTSEMLMGKIFFMEISRGGKESTFDIMPIDWILVHASHMKILSSEAIDNLKTRFIVQIIDKPVDDFAQMLYATMESSNGGELTIIGLTEDIVKKSIDAMKSSLLKAKV